MSLDIWTEAGYDERFAMLYNSVVVQKSSWSKTAVGLIVSINLEEGSTSLYGLGGPRGGPVKHGDCRKPEPPALNRSAHRKGWWTSQQRCGLGALGLEEQRRYGETTQGSGGSDNTSFVISDEGTGWDCLVEAGNSSPGSVSLIEDDDDVAGSSKGSVVCLSNRSEAKVLELTGGAGDAEDSGNSPAPGPTHAPDQSEALEQKYRIRFRETVETSEPKKKESSCLETGGRASVGPSSVWGHVGAGSEEAGEKREGGGENGLNERKRKRRGQSVPHRDKRMRRDEGKGERMISDQGRAGDLKGKETSRGGLVPFCELDRSCLSGPTLGTRKMTRLRDIVSVPVRSGTSALKLPAQIDLGSQAEAQKEEKEPVSADLCILDHFEEFYVKGELIGEGSFGRVYKGYRKLDNLPVALKFVDRTKITRWVKKSDTEDALPLEIVLQELVCSNPPCPGVIRLLEYYKLPTCYLLVLERPVPCLDLFDYLEEEDYLDEPLARHFLWQIVEALQHCHARGVVHGDLKPENILLETADHRLKLLDFGLADYLRDEIYTDLSGTREYFPPEKIRQRGYRAIPATVWSVGILLFQIVCGHLPSHNKKKVLEATLYFPRRISQDCRHLIRGCLSACPEKRPTLDEILQHPWMQH